MEVSTTIKTERSLESKKEPSQALNTSRIGSDTTQATSLSVAAVRHSRVKIEMDVTHLHTRIQLLQSEEERALRMIENTRAKADRILKTRTEHEVFKNQLETVREKEFKRR